MNAPQMKEQLEKLEKQKNELLAYDAQGNSHFPRDLKDLAVACALSLEMSLSALKMIQSIVAGVEAAQVFKLAEEKNKVGRA